MYGTAGNWVADLLCVLSVVRKEGSKRPVNLWQEEKIVTRYGTRKSEWSLFAGHKASDHDEGLVAIL